MIGLSAILSVFAQRPDVNYDESRVPAHTLPDPLISESGEKVTVAALWRAQRRPAILKMFESRMYGRSHGTPAGHELRSH